MMEYDVIFSPEARDDIEKLKKSELSAVRKIAKLIDELRKHPRTGTGKPEQLKGERSGQWSRRITKKHRLIYEIVEDKVYVYVLAAYGHYE